MAKELHKSGRRLCYKVRARSLSPPLWPLHLNILLISANQLFICRPRFNSPVFIPLTLSWQARVCVKAVSQDWAIGSRSAVSLACVEGICILKTELIPFLWSALVGSCPRRVLPVLSSTLAVGGDFRTKRAVGQGWEHGPGVQETWLQSLLARGHSR